MARKKIVNRVEGCPTIPWSDLREWTFNSLKDQERDVRRLKKAMTKKGFCFPLFVWEPGRYVFDGTGRKKALDELVADLYEIPEIPVVKVKAENLDDAKDLALMASSHHGHVTQKSFDLFVGTIGGIDITALSQRIHFDGIRLKVADRKKLRDKDHSDIGKASERAKLGDIWELGDHRVIVGDCTDAATYDALFKGGEKSEMLFTSPPYSKIRKYKGGELDPAHLAKFLPRSAPHSEFACVNLGFVITDGAVDRYWDHYLDAANKAGLKLLSWNVWDRGAPGTIGQTKTMFNIEHEFIFVFGKKRKNMNRTVPNKSAGEWKSGRHRNSDGDMISHGMIQIASHRTLGTVIRMPTYHGKNVGHPAVFPIEFPAEYIKAMTKEGQIVLDVFLGSGSTLLAAERTGRICYGIELSPRYVDIIIQRWEYETGRKAKTPKRAAKKKKEKAKSKAKSKSKTNRKR